MSWCWILSNNFSAFIERMPHEFSHLFHEQDNYISWFQMWSPSCITGISSHSNLAMICCLFISCSFRLLKFCLGCLYLCSWVKSAYNLPFSCCPHLLLEGRFLWASQTELGSVPSVSILCKSFCDILIICFLKSVKPAFEAL